MNPRSTGQSGASLLEILVALGIGGFIVTSMSELMNNNMKANRHNEIRSDIESARRLIAKTFSCPNSLGVQSGTKVTSCAAFPIMNLQNASLVDPLGRLGTSSLYIRTRCVPETGLFRCRLRGKSRLGRDEKWDSGLRNSSGRSARNAEMCVRYGSDYYDSDDFQWHPIDNGPW